MFQPYEDALQVRLVPEDVETAQTAGVQFARALAGAPTTAFLVALGEQEKLVRRAVVEAGLGKRVARTAADVFEVGARLEWQRLAPAALQGVVGLA